MSAVPKPDYLFRPMLADDLDDVVQIEKTVYSHPWTHGNFSDSLKSKHRADVMLVDGRIMGYALMLIVLDEAQLLNISIAKQYQKKGYGRSLLLHLLSEAQKANAVNMFLEVRAGNATAIALYESIGFVEMSLRRGYYPAAKGREDAVLMGLAI